MYEQTMNLNSEPLSQGDMDFLDAMLAKYRTED
jgi:hypothetical protein